MDSTGFSNYKYCKYILITLASDYFRPVNKNSSDNLLSIIDIIDDKINEF